MEGDQADLDAVQAEHLVKGGKMARYLPEKYKNKVSAIHLKMSIKFYSPWPALDPKS